MNDDAHKKSACRESFCKNIYQRDKMLILHIQLFHMLTYLFGCIIDLSKKRLHM